MDWDLVVPGGALLVSLVGTGYTILRARGGDAEGVRQGLRAYTDRQVQVVLARVEEQATSETRFAQHVEERLEGIGTRVEAVSDRIGVLSTDLARLLGADLSGRLARAEQDVQGTARQVAGIHAEIQSIARLLAEIREDARRGRGGPS